MSKFDMSKISGINGSGQGLKLGAGLLSDESKKYATEKVEDIYLLDVEDIEPNPKNKLSQSNIEEMAELIKLAGGIEQNMVGYRLDNGKVRLTTGERRYRGAKLLKEQEGLDFKLPVRIKNYQELDLPLDDENKELFAIHITNKYRDKTNADRMVEVRDWKRIIEQLRENGVEVLQIKDKEGINVIGEQQIAGEKTREIIAKQTGMSTGQVARYESILQPGREDLAAAVMDSTLDLAGAEALKEYPKEERQKILDKAENQPMSAQTVKDELKEHNEKTKARHIKLSIEEMIDDAKMIVNVLQETADALHGADMEIDSDTYDRYQKCMKNLKKIIKDF